MYQQSVLIFTAVTLFTLTSLADKKSDLSNEYTNFRQLQTTFFSTPVNKQNFAAKVTKLLSMLNNSYDKVKVLETGGAEIVLSIEGNQMAYDLEILEPLRDLAKAGINADSCKEVNHDNQMNKTKDADVQEVTTLLKKLCS